MEETKKEPKEVEVKVDHSNPFNKGVTYESFLKEIGKKTVKEALKGKCTDEEIAWVETEVKHYKTNKK